LITPSPTPAALPPTQTIVARAYDRLRSYGTPPYVVYMTNENGDIHRIAFRASDEMMNDSEYIRQTTLPLTSIYRAFVGPLSITVHEAVVQATPNPSATSASALASSTPAAQEQSSLVSDLKTIAVVNARARPVYTVTSSSAETIDGYNTDHLVLDPTNDPTRHALRDLWIDTTTYDVRRADYVTTDANVPGATVYLTVNFEPVGPYWIAAGWVAIYHTLGPGAPVYRQLHIEKMRFPSELPGWLWDDREYEAHRRARALDPLAGIFDASPGP
jgi:hypothetical protein